MRTSENPLWANSRKYRRRLETQFVGLPGEPLNLYYFRPSFSISSKRAS
jgi:hypothetical protein